MNETNRDLLDRITAAYNAEIEENRRRGDLDFVPQPSTPNDVLTVILVEYARRHYPDTLPTTKED